MAPRAAVRFAATSEVLSLAGMVSTRFTMWMVPPVKLTFWGGESAQALLPYSFEKDEKKDEKAYLQQW